MHTIRTLVLAAGLAATSNTLLGQNVITRANNATSVNLNGAWLGGAAPGASDIALWNSTVSGAQVNSFSGNVNWLGIRITNPGGDISTTVGNAVVTLGSAGIDMTAATANLTLNRNIVLSADQTWDVANGRLLTINPGSPATTTGMGANALTIQGAGNTTINSILGGTGQLTKDGAGTLTLTGNNTYTGRTVVNKGVLSISSENNLGGNPGSFTADQLTLDGGTLRTTSSFTVNDSRRGVTLGAAGGTFDVNSGTIFSLDRSIAGSGSLTKVGDGMLRLYEVNTYGGDTIVSAGILELQNSSAIPFGTGKGNVIVDGTLALRNYNVSINGLSGGGTVAKSSGVPTRTLTVGNNDASGNFTGTITDDTGTLNLTKTGSGTQILSGNNTYAGATVVDQGALRIGHNNALGLTDSGTTVNSGAALEMFNNITTPGGESLALNGQGVANGGALRNVSGNNTFSGTVALNSDSRINSDSGTLAVAGDVSGGGNNLTVGGAGNVTVNSVISGGSTTLTKDGSGTLTLNGANTYGGGTILSEGTLVLGADNVLPDGGSINFAGGTLSLNDRTELVGMLVLSEDSVLYLTGDGDVHGTLEFTSASATPGSTLTIVGWQGIAEFEATDDRIVIATDPGATFLSQVQFDVGGIYYHAYWNSDNFELTPGLTPVPEKVHWALMIFGLAAVSIKFVVPWLRHRRRSRYHLVLSRV